ncbi:MAG: decarboxylating NADP(+)-dependent phosphogluconate dehydrogenase, partial [Nitrospinota bacterium]
MNTDLNADIGVIGLGVMGQNLILNMNDHGFRVAVFNRTPSKVDEFLNGNAKGTNVVGVYSPEELIASLTRPRRIMFMVKAGRAVDMVIETLLPHLEEGDIIIDGGNANFEDSIRVGKYLESKNLLYVGCGVSGGEEGARNGPSMMPGGTKAAWPHVKGLFQAISAKAPDGTPCCDWGGDSGAGHFVKMVHNGIEYGDMQIISEVFDIFKTGLGMEPGEIGDIFKKWNQRKLNSYLIDITGDILQFADEDGTPLVNKILDKAGQKGTGTWTSVSALEMSVPLTLISEAVFARCVSALKDERLIASESLPGPGAEARFDGDKNAFINEVEEALYASKIISYAQGYMLFRAASDAYKWDLNYGGISLMWREGCIIRASFLEKIKEAFDNNPKLVN